MKLQKHYTRKDKSQWKFETVLPKKEVEQIGFKEGDELDVEVVKKGLLLKKKPLKT